jgi:Kef-type K+ transport system membrane component KefB
VESLPLAFSSGWASGVNAYLVVLVLGIADRLGDYAEVPDVLARWDILAIAGFMYAMEFVADKIPYVDSTWDAVSTLIRPTAGAVIGALLAGSVPEDTSLDTIVLAGVGGTTALLSHLSKAGLRLAINTSPEPVTNIGVSLVEDLAVLALVAFAIQHPRAAAAVAGVLLTLGLVLLLLVARLVRRGWRRWKDRRQPAGAVP